MNLNGKEYFYIRNVQNDVIGLHDSEGKVVVNYSYDTWGNIVSISGSLKDSVGKKNPYRYRGYRYDEETGMYYLQSRYYNGSWGRFVNCDDIGGKIGELGTHNAFKYCFNNPVNMSDESGQWPKWIKKAAKKAAKVAAKVAVTAVVVTAIVVAAPAVACAVGTGVALAIGASAATATAIAAVTATACYVTAAAVGAFGINRAYQAATGKNVIKNTVFRGNQKAYNRAEGIVNSVGGLIIAGSTVVGPGSVCFVAGTMISTEKGNVPIEKIKVGDLVYSENPETGEKGLKRVVQTFENETDELVHIKVNGEEIVTTPEHPFYVPRQGWTEAIKLRAGDILVLVNGKEVVVEKVQHEILETPIKVYNFEVEDYHTYYVSNSGVLVHNQCTNPYGKKGGPAHQAKIAEMEKKLSQRGYNLIKEEVRIDISNGYKSRRYADFAVSKNNKTIYVQVGKQTKSGMPVIRERRAISDIESEGNTVWFFAYN